MFKEFFLEMTKRIPIRYKRKIPNQISVSRKALALLLLLVTILAIIQKEFIITSYILIVLCTVAGLSDFIDGYIARAWKVMSKKGKRLDEIADKLIFLSICISIWLINYFRSGIVFEIWYLLLITIGVRDVLVTLLRNNFEKFKERLSVKNKKKLKPIAVHPFAKTKTVMIFLGAICFYAYQVFLSVAYVGNILYWIVFVLFVVAFASAIISGFEYRKQYMSRYQLE